MLILTGFSQFLPIVVVIYIFSTIPFVSPLYVFSPLCESRAIMMYLCNKYCTEENQYLYPLEPEYRGKVDKYLFFDMGTFNSAITEYFKPKYDYELCMETEKENQMKQALSYLNEFLEEAGTPFLVGQNPTIADISILASITDLDAVDYNYRFYGEVGRYSDRLKSSIASYAECCLKGVEMQKARVKQVEQDYKEEMEKEIRKTTKINIHK